MKNFANFQSVFAKANKTETKKEESYLMSKGWKFIIGCEEIRGRGSRILCRYVPFGGSAGNFRPILSVIRRDTDYFGRFYPSLYQVRVILVGF